MINKITIVCALTLPVLTWTASAEEPVRAELAPPIERTVYLSVDGMG